MTTPQKNIPQIPRPGSQLPSQYPSATLVSPRRIADQPGDAHGRRLQVLVEGQGAITYTLDYLAGGRAAKRGGRNSHRHGALPLPFATGKAQSGLGGFDCLGEYRDEGQDGEANGWLYYLYDATRHVRQGVDTGGELVSTWRASQRPRWGHAGRAGWAAAKRAT